MVAIYLAGELATTAPDRSSGRFESEFEYARAWVSEPNSFALDPVSLPLDSARRFRGRDAVSPLWRSSKMRCRTIGVGACLPRRSPPTIAEGRHYLRCCCALRGGGHRALLFTETDTAPHPDQSAPSTALSKLLAAAAQFEAGTLPTGDEFRRLLEGSSRAGGARPKALVHDESGEWLAKFPSRARDDCVRRRWPWKPPV